MKLCARAERSVLLPLVCKVTLTLGRTLTLTLTPTLTPTLTLTLTPTLPLTSTSLWEHHSSGTVLQICLYSQLLKVVSSSN